MTEKEMVKEWGSKGQDIIKVIFPEPPKAFRCYCFHGLSGTLHGDHGALASVYSLECPFKWRNGYIENLTHQSRELQVSKIWIENQPYCLFITAISIFEADKMSISIFPTLLQIASDEAVSIHLFCSIHRPVAAAMSNSLLSSKASWHTHTQAHTHTHTLLRCPHSPASTHSSDCGQRQINWGAFVLNTHKTSLVKSNKYKLKNSCLHAVRFSHQHGIEYQYFPRYWGQKFKYCHNTGGHWSEKQDGKRVETCFSAMRAQWVAGEAGDGCREVVRCDASRSMGWMTHYRPNFTLCMAEGGAGGCSVRSTHTHTHTHSEHGRASKQLG